MSGNELFRVALVFSLGVPLPLAVADATECAKAHSASQGEDFWSPPSPHIHPHREGVIVPMGPSASAMMLAEVKVDAQASFFHCMVRNLSVGVRAEFALVPSPYTVADTEPVVALPITTHALYGDHNMCREIHVLLDGQPVDYRVAMDFRKWKTDQGLFYQGQMVNYDVHPLLKEAKDLNLIAPHLVAEGFDLVLYWHIPSSDAAVPYRRIVVEYRSSSNDFSQCCREVRACTHSQAPYYFYFDLSNARYWAGRPNCTVTLNDSKTGQWACVPTTSMTTHCDRDSILLESLDQPLEDLAAPVQPAVFDIWPRRFVGTWGGNNPDGEPTWGPTLYEEFQVSYLGDATMIDHATVNDILGVGGIDIYAELPMTLDETHPTARFGTSYTPPISPPAYVDVFGAGGQEMGNDGLHSLWLRVPLSGRVIMGHDLAIQDVEVIPPGPDGAGWTIAVTLANRGVFTDPLEVSVFVGHRYVKTSGFRSLEPGQEVRVTIPIDWQWELPALVSAEVEPIPGEVQRLNNRASVEYPGPPIPRHANFVLQPEQCVLRFFLEDGRVYESKLAGDIQIFLGDPHVPVIALPGMVGLSIDGATLIAPCPLDAASYADVLPRPLVMYQDPEVRSIGSWNMHTGDINFELQLITPDGHLPANQPTRFHGRLSNAGLVVKGISSENTAIPRMVMDIWAYEAPLPPEPELWFSTQIGFTAGNLDPDPAGQPPHISAGDLLSARGHIVRRNYELTGNLGIMPVVPDLGLDAVMIGPKHDVWFSFEKEHGALWSESLGRLLKHGDLLSERGYVVATNEELLAKFVRMPVAADAGLDAVCRAPNGAIFFSVEEGFFSEAMGRYVSDGDLLSNRGRIVMTNVELLRNFHSLSMRPAGMEGLDAIILRPNKEIWFSIENGFPDGEHGWIDGGDLLSDKGYVVARNGKLLDPFGPLEEVASFGLDAVNVFVHNRIADFDFDGDVDGMDRDLLLATTSGPNVPSDEPINGDLDGDGDVDQSDFGLLQRCFSGDGVPADEACAE